MNSLYKQFVTAALTTLFISTLIGFLIVNTYYTDVTKHNTDEQLVEIAYHVVDFLENTPLSTEAVFEYLDSVALLGYQIHLDNFEGDTYVFGEPFNSSHPLSDSAKEIVQGGEVYHGVRHLKNGMFSHFDNELRNTVGVPYHKGETAYGLYIRASNDTVTTDFHKLLIVFLLIIAVVNVLGMLLLARHMTKSISYLTEATKQIAVENYNYHLHISRKDEIGQLASSFHLMQIKLRHNDLARKTFISNVSHDYQSPLMSIQGYAQLLKSPVIDDSERMEYAAIIEKETQRLSNLTNQLLVVTSLDQESYPMTYTDLQLDLQIKEVIRKYWWRIEEANIDVSYILPSTTIYGDKKLLENIWDNLLTNAVKYNKPGGLIDVSIVPLGKSVEVIFRDTGIGVEEEDLPYIFDKFYRVDPSRPKEGTGLGLSIVKQIVDLHQGTVEVESTPGVGTKFKVRLPLSRSIKS
ncbi:ATP-binding protein [Paenibacillus shunpengii]|uniref:Heme sensor protein HssS n=1 Tax=Paenibacillus shunpengii TaxID=2054424 RepID=A0ABW5SMX6_9BACL